MTEFFVGLGIGAVAGFGWGRAFVAETVARLASELEIARQTGTLRATHMPSTGLRERVIKSLMPNTLQPTTTQATDETVAKHAAIQRGADMILADAKGAGRSMRYEEAKQLAADMIAEAGLT